MLRTGGTRGSPLTPFAALRDEIAGQTATRAAITAAYRRPERECLPPLLALARLSPDLQDQTRETARTLVEALRAKPPAGGVQALVREFSLSSDEGVALMCLAEALLRIPDVATRDALIRDKLGGGDWRAHLGRSPSIFVNAATWGLVVSGRLVSTSSEDHLSSALVHLVARGGEPLIRRGVDLAMRLLGEQFVTGRTIDEALARGRRMEARGFRYSFDMLGEAAMTAADAERYRRAYQDALTAIGAASAGRGVIDGPGLSIKLSALHPRYVRAQRGRLLRELGPTLRSLVVQARALDVGINIDAEESSRLDLSLDLLEALCHDPDLAGWDGVGFVVQAYQKRSIHVIDHLIDLARRSGRRLMVRLVKGAYWDSEIKLAQVDGQADFPVFTRKVHTDVSYLACARTLLSARGAIYPQFATHNAQTLAAVRAMAGPEPAAGRYEFQCLHGMGEPLYEEVVGPAKLDIPCRIYAPVGTHETLLAYLVRRLLENGANSSFVNRIHDPAIAVDDLVTDPVDAAAAISSVGAPHPRIALPLDLFGPTRRNSLGLDLTDEGVLATLAQTLPAPASEAVRAAPPHLSAAPPREVRNPARLEDRVGEVVDADEPAIELALAAATQAAPQWADVAPAVRAANLERAADLLQQRRVDLIGVIVREAGKTLANAVGEVREAVDFLRYYAAEARAFGATPAKPLGPVACISPWNFPLAIFIGQVAAALAAGNTVLAKPAEETPLIAAMALAILIEAGVPADAAQLVPGEGRVGARLVADPRVQGVMFTGSTEVARLIQRSLAERLDAQGRPIPLIAETGGINAMVVDSSALTEQVVADVIQSAFDSAGQRCSALRLLCLQDDVADRTLTMLRGAMRELRLGAPDLLATDVGPVISAQARESLEAYIARARSDGRRVHRIERPEDLDGHFVAPTLIELDHVGQLSEEVFGPVLHVVRFRHDDLEAVIDQINASGFALTFGLHTRIDETVARALGRAKAGNLYINRNMIGAVVGVQPFGGGGLSGTGPKAGGPLYLRRLCRGAPPITLQTPTSLDPARAWLNHLGPLDPSAVRLCADMIARVRVGPDTVLPGPVGEDNRYGLHPRGAVLCVARTPLGLATQIGAALCTGNRAIVDPTSPIGPIARLPAELGDWVTTVERRADAAFAAVLFEGDPETLLSLGREMADRPGPIIPIHALTHEAIAAGAESYPLEWLLEERSISQNTAAAGGNATLMSLS